jgi:hypothetical protein
VTGELRKLHNEELRDLYSSPSIIGMIKSRSRDGLGIKYEWGRKGPHYMLFVGTPERKRLLGRQRRRWVDSIRMDLEEVGWGNVDWIGLAQDRDKWRALVNSVLNLRVP